MVDLAIARHTLVWIAPHARNAVIAIEPDAKPILAHWLACDRPLIVRRRDDATSEHDVALGFPLPPAQGKRRVPVIAPLAAIARVAPPPRLADMVHCLPGPWSSALAPLLDAADALQIELRVYGSAAWQSLTGLPYLTLGSDIDLLWRPMCSAQIDSGIAMLREWEARAQLRADGEIVLADECAVAWREWALPNARVLAKNLAGACLCERSQLLRHWSGEALCA